MKQVITASLNDWGKRLLKTDKPVSIMYSGTGTLDLDSMIEIMSKEVPRELFDLNSVRTTAVEEYMVNDVVKITVPEKYGSTSFTVHVTKVDVNSVTVDTSKYYDFVGYKKELSFDPITGEEISKKKKNIITFTPVTQIEAEGYWKRREFLDNMSEIVSSIINLTTWRDADMEDYFAKMNSYDTNRYSGSLFNMLHQFITDNPVEIESDIND